MFLKKSTESKKNLVKDLWIKDLDRSFTDTDRDHNK